MSDGPETPPAAGVEAKDEQEESHAEKGNVRWLRLLLLVIVLLSLWGAAKALGVQDYMERERIRELVDGAGALGVLVFIGVFAVGELLHVPGIVFVGAAVLAWGDSVGALWSFCGAVVSVTVSFLVVRGIGGQPLAAVKRPFVRKILAKLDERPIAVVLVLRLIFWMAPPINYALAMSRVRFSHYVVGSALGLLLPVTLAAFFFEWAFG